MPRSAEDMTASECAALRESGFCPSVRAAIFNVTNALDQWAVAHGELAKAEEVLLAFELKGSHPPPREMLHSVVALRRRADRLFLRARLLARRHEALNASVL